MKERVGREGERRGFEGADIFDIFDIFDSFEGFCALDSTVGLVISIS